MQLSFTLRTHCEGARFEGETTSKMVSGQECYSRQSRRKEEMKSFSYLVKLPPLKILQSQTQRRVCSWLRSSRTLTVQAYWKVLLELRQVGSSWERAKLSAYWLVMVKLDSISVRLHPPQYDYSQSSPNENRCLANSSLLPKHNALKSLIYSCQLENMSLYMVLYRQTHQKRTLIVLVLFLPILKKKVNRKQSKRSVRYCDSDSGMWGQLGVKLTYIQYRQMKGFRTMVVAILVVIVWPAVSDQLGSSAQTDSSLILPEEGRQASTRVEERKPKVLSFQQASLNLHNLELFLQTVNKSFLVFNSYISAAKNLMADFKIVEILAVVSSILNFITDGEHILTFVLTVFFFWVMPEEEQEEREQYQGIQKEEEESELRE